MDYTKLPVILIGNYLWDLAKGDVNGSTQLPSAVWDTDAYTVQPIFAINDSNAITNPSPYILYDFLYTGVDLKCFPLIKEEATLTIVGPWNKLYPLKNFIYDALSKFDISAFEINNHIRDTGINFKYIKVRQEQYALDEKKPVGLESGLNLSTLYVTYEYSRS
jgi:hypothetical protein